MGRVIGHYAPRLLVGVVAVLVLLTLVPAAAVFVPWPALLVVFALAFLLGVSILVHNRRLCERCIAALPLDASSVAGRYAIRFRVAHLFESRLFALGYLVVLAGSAFLAGDPLGRYAWAAAEASLGYLLLVYVTHQRLQPWCPYCKHGGEEQSTPTTPDPVSTQM
jgi:hypothetical protein